MVPIIVPNHLHQPSSNRDLADVLPEGFSINAFTSKKVSIMANKHASFFLDTEIPRVGTDTKIE